MLDTRVFVAPTGQHDSLNQLYLRWGYHGGIADADIVYVAQVDRRPVGIVRRSIESGVVMLRGMQVAPDHQRQGVGTELLRAFVADLPPSDCYCIPFAHLTAFYGQGGFSVLDEPQAPEFLRERLRRYRAEGHAVLVMRREAARFARD